MPQRQDAETVLRVQKHVENLQRSLLRTISFFEPVNTSKEGVEHFIWMVSSPIFFGVLTAAALSFSLLSLLAATAYFCVGSLNESSDQLSYMGVGIATMIAFACAAAIAPAVLCFSLISRLMVTSQQPSLENKFAVAARNLNI